MFKRTLTAAALVLATSSVAVSAAQQNGLVNITITDVTVLQDFLNNAQIAALNEIAVPINVQVPVAVAANICGISIAAVLAAAGSGAICNAESGSAALARLAVAQNLKQNR